LRPIALQVSGLMLWVNIASAALGGGLVIYERRTKGKEASYVHP